MKRLILVLLTLCMLISCASIVSTKSKKPTKQTEIIDIGEIPYGRLSLRASEFEGNRLTVKCTFGGVCTIGGPKDWVIFPLHDETTNIPGPCTIISPIVGAIARKNSEIIENLKYNDVVIATGILTQNYIMVGQNNQYSLEIESIKKVGQNKPGKNPFGG